MSDDARIGFTQMAKNSTIDWSEADRLWFEANPRRAHRLRPAYPDEFATVADELIPAPEGFIVAVVVRQIAPGVRVRRPLGWRAENPFDLPEMALDGLFDELISGSGKGFTLSDLLRRGAALRARGMPQ